MMRYLTGVGYLACLLGGACGHGAQTLDVHAEGQVQVEAHAATRPRDDPGESAMVTVVGCQPGNTAAGASICWSDLADKSLERKSSVERQLRVETQLRSTCDALVPAEAEFCQGVSERDKALSPLSHYGDIASVMELKVERYLPGQTGPVLQVVGGRLVFDEVPGLTKDRLERLIQCHLARHRALSYRMEDVSEDPLSLQGIRVLVEPVGTGLAIDVRAADTEVVAKVLDRIRKIGLRAVSARKH